jgi:hypothetical protein
MQLAVLLVAVAVGACTPIAAAEGAAGPAVATLADTGLSAFAGEDCYTYSRSRILCSPRRYRRQLRSSTSRPQLHWNLEYL